VEASDAESDAPVAKAVTKKAARRKMAKPKDTSADEADEAPNKSKAATRVSGRARNPVKSYKELPEMSEDSQQSVIPKKKPAKRGKKMAKAISSDEEMEDVPADDEVAKKATNQRVPEVKADKPDEDDAVHGDVGKKAIVEKRGAKSKATSKDEITGDAPEIPEESTKKATAKRGGTKAKAKESTKASGSAAEFEDREEKVEAKVAPKRKAVDADPEAHDVKE
jgi:hypothetical protein